MFLCPFVCGARGRVDTEASRDYALEFDTQYVPLNTYTLDVDYTDITVQVKFT